MSVIGSNILAGASGQGGGYNLTKSLRFRSSANAYLNRTFGTPTDTKKFTWSGWVKRGTLGAFQVLQCGDDGTSDNFLSLRFGDTDTLQCYQISGGSYNLQVSTSAVFRDPSAWYHIVFIYDSANATSTNRIQFYVNGVLQTVSYAVGPFAQNTASQLNVASRPNAIGRLLYASVNYFDGYLAEVNFIDGQALTPSSFGETSTTTGVWIPKKYTGTYGTNGFYLPFTDTTSTSTLGTDFSGNSNTWTVNNISLTAGSTYDSMTDVPTLTSATTANYATLNPLDSYSTAISNGNLKFSDGSGNAYQAYSTMSNPNIATYKFYCEVTVEIAYLVGIVPETKSAANGSTDRTSLLGYYSTGNKYNGTSASAYGATFTTGDIIGIAFGNGQVEFYKNNVSQGVAFSSLTGGYKVATWAAGSAGIGCSFNFGQRPFSYTPPANFVALNTFNLPTPTIGYSAAELANEYFDATLYTGNGGTLAVTNSGSMQPDFVWLKSRSAGYDHLLFDSIRGTGKALFSPSTAVETTTNNMSAFNSNGFTALYDATYIGSNNSGVTMVGWQWRASNAAAVTNTSGSISSQVSASTTAGFSIVTFTGNGTSGTVGHGLGVAPSMVIVKSRSTAQRWTVFHTSTSNAYIYLNETFAADTTNANVRFGDNTVVVQPTSTVFSIGNSADVNQNTTTYVAYCFAAVSGYSAFGSYSSNVSSDGPFIYTGFRPRFVMIKKATGSVNANAGWYMFDTVRGTYNVIGPYVQANLSDAEGTASIIDTLSNGFKIRIVDISVNGGTAGDTYIYMAFAENPFKYANAR